MISQQHDGAKHKRVFSKEHRENLSAAMKACTRSTGAASSRWKGDQVGYSALHSWMQNTFGAPATCEHCAQTKGMFDWANKSGGYLRDRSDWVRLCRSCHMKYDQRGFQVKHMYEHEGETLSLKEWASRSGVKYDTLYKRIFKQGLPLAQALVKGKNHG